MPTLFSHNDIDICNKTDIKQVVAKYDIIINCAAYTNVDAAENNKKLCLDINGESLLALAEECKLKNKKLIHISSDFVYGTILHKINCGELTENEILNPINTYGYSKLIGEQHILNTLISNYLILRVSWVFGNKSNFIQKIVEGLISKDKKKLFVVNDQIGRPTSVHLISKTILAYIYDDIPAGIYNLQNNGTNISKFELAKYIKKYIKMHKHIIPIKTDNSRKYIC